MKNKISANYNVNTITEMLSIKAQSGDICLVSGKYYKYNGKEWDTYKGKK
jgi:hypothetical protein